MKAYGDKLETFPVPADTVNTILLAAATAQSMDYPTNTQIMRVTGLSSAGAQLNFYCNPMSTAAVLPTSGSSATTGSSGNSVPVVGTRQFAVVSSTSFGLIAPTSGYVHVECWRR